MVESWFNQFFQWTTHRLGWMAVGSQCLAYRFCCTQLLICLQVRSAALYSKQNLDSVECLYDLGDFARNLKFCIFANEWFNSLRSFVPQPSLSSNFLVFRITRRYNWRSWVEVHARNHYYDLCSHMIKHGSRTSRTLSTVSSSWYTYYLSQW